MLIDTKTKEFSMDRNLLVSVMKAQAGTLSKALLEGIMNSMDAGASSVHIEITETGFSLQDDGKGFTSRSDIDTWFGRFGTPHIEGDAKWGTFRMGRGQIFSYASTIWHSNTFQMAVDIEGQGLTYELSERDDHLPGCRIEGVLYAPLTCYEIQEVLNDIRKLVAYAQTPVFVNGLHFGASAAKNTSWTYEDDDAYYLVTHDSPELLVYNQGIYVETLGSWRIGIGGVIVSKKPLMVNFARNAILESKCQTWKAIREIAQSQVELKLSQAKQLNANERDYLSRRALNAQGKFKESVRKAKLITTPTGKHLSLESLFQFEKFIYIAELGPLACAVQGTSKTFVVTDYLLARFSYYGIHEFFRALRDFGGLLNPVAVIVDASEMELLGLGGTRLVSLGDSNSQLKAEFQTVTWLNEKISERLGFLNSSFKQRKLLLGAHKRNMFVAWTDGSSYITVNKTYLKRLRLGLDGAMYWAQILIHEYMHEVDDSESHSHGEVFYQKYHDAMQSHDVLSLGSLTQETVVYYLNQLAEYRIARPHVLTRQLRPSLKN